ncbi:MAG TPA: AAA family ATPase [Allosphingosinicella sp.]|nr:AAA family ATPase [Allosphingosinicella sp.]
MMATVFDAREWDSRYGGDASQRADRTPAPPTIKATPYACVDPRTIPLRPWVYGRQFLRGSLSLVVAPGATGKTALLAGTALALTTGRPLLDKTVWDGPKRVWLWNLEDSLGELSRLIEAARLHWGISADDIGGRLFVDSALDGADLKMAVEDRDGFRIVRPVIDALVEELIARQIDVLIVDPFVSSHSCSENDNGAIDAIAKEWARVGVKANCSVVLVHHTRKLGGGEATAEGARGAVALVGAARSVVALNKMTPEEANSFGVEGEERRRFFRAYDDKNNRTPPADKSDWYQLASVDLGNGPVGGHGDSLPVVLPWTCPDAFTGITSGHLARVQEAVRAGEWRDSDQSEDWVGEAVASVLDLDVSDRKSADALRVKKLVKAWKASKLLVKVTKHCPKARREKPFVEAGGPVEL